MARVRFAPSPTGQLHLGSARTAVFNWLYARHTGGQLILRIEDTDLNRSENQYTDSILKDMAWMGMDHQEFYKQSDRFEIYRAHCDKLLEMGKAYYCTCTKDDLIERNKKKGITDEITKYDGHCRGNKAKPEGQHVVRLDLGEDRDIIFKDVVRGRIRVNTKELDDFVLWKGDNSPTYNFAVVIDDSLMKMSHIIRGEDHITNTAKQIVLYEYLGFPVPEFAHLPLVFDKDHTRLSKRKGSTNIDYYRRKGVLPEALLNYIARLGWSHGDDEIFTVPQLIEYFTLDRLNKSNAVYDEDKMIWVNARHMKSIDIPALAKHFGEFMEEAGISPVGRMTDPEWFARAAEILRERNNSLADLYEDMKAYALDKYEMTPEAQAKLAELDSEPGVKEAYPAAKTAAIEASASGNFDGLEDKLRSLAEQSGVKFGKLVQLLRIKLTGKTVSPDIISVIRLLGKEASARL
ncbi:MAG: glutamate--tRNA ligase [Spirochaetes bacterium GWF1_51_8]|nr:MAG: glutamate--tRNA ligase [Spirochaetes bacterium GWF1_51_8]